VATGALLEEVTAADAADWAAASAAASRAAVFAAADFASSDSAVDAEDAVDVETAAEPAAVAVPGERPVAITPPTTAVPAAAPMATRRVTRFTMRSPARRRSVAPVCSFFITSPVAFVFCFQEISAGSVGPRCSL
jgi:hypothetical protein